VNEVVNATVKRIEGPDVILDIGKAEARMGKKEQSRLESFAVGERIRVRDRGEVTVKGKRQNVAIFELDGLAWDAAGTWWP